MDIKKSAGLVSKIIAALVCAVLLVAGIVFWPAPVLGYSFPGGHSFALAICDDTDGANLANIQPVYDFLDSNGVVATKTVWPLAVSPDEDAYTFGESLQNEAYRDYIVSLKERGYEIAFHGARGGSSNRQIIEKGLDFYKQVVKEDPKIHINHRLNKDNLYWGAQRFSITGLRWLYSLVMPDLTFEGEQESSQYFWGDLARGKVRYSRDFSFHELNLAKIPGYIPFHDVGRPYIKYWFHTSDGHDVDAFNRLLSESNIDDIEREGGYSIVYTHFAKGFYVDGNLNDDFKLRIQDLKSRDVWITTTGELLSFLENANRERRAGWWPAFRRESRWIVEKVIYGSS